MIRDEILIDFGPLKKTGFFISVKTSTKFRFVFLLFTEPLEETLFRPVKSSSVYKVRFYLILVSSP